MSLTIDESKTSAQDNMIAPGKHLLIDLWGIKEATNIELISKMMREAAEACGATVLDINLHEFGEGYGVTGVVILAESHMSIHTWPEISYAALDVFMCGSCDTSKAIPVFEKYLSPTEIKVSEYERGKRDI